MKTDFLFSSRLQSSLQLTLSFVLFCSSLFGSLTVTSVNPSTGAIDQGEPVTLKGTGLSTVDEVLFGSVKSPDFQIQSDDTIVAITPVPIGPAGLVHVKVNDSSTHTASSISYQNRYVFTHGNWLAYLTHSETSSKGSVIPFSIAKGHPTPPAISFNGFTDVLAISPNNARLYVVNSNSLSDHRVVIVDIAKNQVINEIPFSNRPMDLAISPSAKTGYVIHGHQLASIDLEASQIVSEVPLPFDGSQLAITPDGRKAYVTHHDADRISVINLAANRIVKSISLYKPYAIGAGPSGEKIYVCSDDEYCRAIDTKNDTIVEKLHVGCKPRCIAINPDGKEAYVGNFGDDTVTVIELASHNHSYSIHVGHGPTSIAVAPDGMIGYVTNAKDGTVTSIDLITRSVLKTESVKNSLSSVVITPDQSPIADFRATFDTFLTLNFDASASISPVGKITSYTWVFEPPSAPGGGTVTTTSPFISHEFGTPGPSSVTLTVTNSAGTSTTQVFTGKMMSRNGSGLAQIVKTVEVPWPDPFSDE